MVRKILLIDDCPADHALLYQILSADYTIVEAKNETEALAMLSNGSETISAILLHFGATMHNRCAALSALRHDAHTARIPILVTADHADFHIEEQALSLGASDYLTKPYRARTIRHRVYNAIHLNEMAVAAKYAKRDELTGLYNRKAFLEVAAEMIAAQERGFYVLSYFDVDHFKVINDQYGNAKGDAVLRQLADIFANGFAGCGGICARLTSDHFVILYPCSFMNTVEIGQIRDKAARLDGSIHPITFSIGRYIVVDQTLTVSSMCDRASLAQAAVKGRFDTHIALYHESMRLHLLQEQSIIGEMNSALAARQFEVWFQPQYNHLTGEQSGAEALVRWRHPVKGLIAPGLFIPLFEKNGFVYEIDKFVWEQVCQHLRRWLDAGLHPVPISVNISRYDVFREDLTAVIVGLVQKYRIPMQLLRLEITESAFAKSTDQIIEVVKRLVTLGFTLEIDDFGSGYSSLNTLKDVPAQVIKLDMRFLEGNQNLSRGGNILESMVRMAKWLDMAVIAEGVETIEQADFLKTVGCFDVQGYLYSKPIPLEEYEALPPVKPSVGKRKPLAMVQHMDNNAFWDPNSVDTLIFSSYVGGACVLEYWNGKVNVLRANDKYAQMISSVGLTLADALSISWTAHMDAENCAALFDALECSIATQAEVTREFQFLNLPNCPERSYLRTTLRVIASLGERHLIYSMNENITAQREAEAKEHLAQQRLEAIMANIESGVTAAVTEGDNLRLFFANGKYYEILGHTQQTYQAEVFSPYALIHPEDREMMRQAVQTVLESGASLTRDYRVLRRDGTEIWTRVVLSATRFADVNAPVCLSVMRDVTAEKRLILQQLETDAQLKFLNDTAKDILAEERTEHGMESVLRKTLEYFDGDRAYLYEYHYEKAVCTNVMEVCAAGVQSCRAQYRSIPLAYSACWRDTFATSNFLRIDPVDALPDDRQTEKETYQKCGAHSVLAVALRVGGVVVGAMGLFNARQHLLDYQNLGALGDYMAALLTRRNLNQRIETDQASMLAFLNDTLDGYARIQLFPDGSIRTVYVNDRFCEMRGLTREEILQHDSEDATACVYPEDLPYAQGIVQTMLAENVAKDAHFRLRKGNAGFIPVVMSARIAYNDGDAFINAHFQEQPVSEAATD